MTNGVTEKKGPLTVRELIQQLANCEDMDAEVHTSLFNSDPVPVLSIDTDDETPGQVVLGTQ